MSQMKYARRHFLKGLGVGLGMLPLLLQPSHNTPLLLPPEASQKP